MPGDLLIGFIAGAAGTVALDVTSYGDMVIRDRPPSGVPARVAGTLARKAGLDLTPGDAGPDREEHRQAGIGALLGYVIGLGLGGAYGLLRPRMWRVPAPLAGIGVGLAAMAASDVPSVSLGVTDPKTWGLSGWLADLIPHLAYGLTVAWVFDALAPRPVRRRLWGRG